MNNHEHVHPGLFIEVTFAVIVIPTVGEVCLEMWYFFRDFYHARKKGRAAPAAASVAAAAVDTGAAGAAGSAGAAASNP